MPGVLIRDVPDELHEKLKVRAEAHRRSLGREALVLLEQALSTPAGPPTLEEIDSLRVEGARPLTQELIDSARQAGRS
jgi:plasmid stability protein